MDLVCAADIRLASSDAWFCIKEASPSRVLAGRVLSIASSRRLGGGRVPGKLVVARGYEGGVEGVREERGGGSPGQARWRVYRVGCGGYPCLRRTQW